MDRVKGLFLEALCAFKKSEQVAWTHVTREEWAKLIHMARIHQVLPLLYEAVRQTPAAMEAEPGLMAWLRRQSIQSGAVQAVKTTEFFQLYKKMLQAGCVPLVVKGIICRQLYPQPDLRASGDEDILIPPGQFSSCHQVMTEFGMTAPDDLEWEEAYEVPYRRTGSPLYVEAHKSLFPPESDAYGDLNDLFEGIFDRSVWVQIGDTEIRTLAPTDHLLYLICHGLKHFLHSGIGIRQVMDIVSFAAAYGESIDWRLIREKCHDIHAEQFAAALLRIGEKYLGFSPAKASCPATLLEGPDELPLLEDILSAGLYGDADMSRKHSSGITLNAVAAQKKGEKKSGSVLRTVFPSARDLQGRFPYLKKQPYLLPVAWATRLVKYGVETSGAKQNSAAESIQIGKHRLELLQQYGILSRE